MGTPSPKYTAEFKQRAVELYRKSGTTYAEVARGLGCDPGSLSDWVKKDDAADAPRSENPFQMAEALRRPKRENERLKRAKFEFIFFNEGAWPVPGMCAALKVTRRGHYAWKKRPPSAHAMRDEELATTISRIRAEVHDIYGAPKVFLKLRRTGVCTSRKRVARIMRERGWRGVTRACAKRPSGEKRASRKDSAEDLVRRRFEADGPNRAWFADITYVKTRQGWLYLALVMDIWSRRAVGWAMGPSITAELADEALKMALSRRNSPGGAYTTATTARSTCPCCCPGPCASTASAPRWARYPRRGMTPPWSRSWAWSSRKGCTHGSTPRVTRRRWTCSSTSRSYTTVPGYTWR